MPARGRPRAFNRDAALRSAMEVFWAKGYEGTSLADLTAAMGINAPSLYAAFGSKEKLFLEATELYTRVEGTGIWTVLETAPTTHAAIAGFLKATAEAFSQDGKPQGCLIALGALHHDTSSDIICTDLRRRRAENLAALQRRFERGVAEGELAENFDAAAAAIFYATVQHGMSIQARDGATYEALMDVANGAMAAWEPLMAKAKA